MTPTIGQIDRFIERVAIMEHDAGMTEEEAMESASWLLKP